MKHGTHSGVLVVPAAQCGGLGRPHVNEHLLLRRILQADGKEALEQRAVVQRGVRWQAHGWVGERPCHESVRAQATHTPRTRARGAGGADPCDMQKRFGFSFEQTE